MRNLKFFLQGREALMTKWFTVLDSEAKDSENTVKNPRLNTAVVILGVLGAEFDCLGFRTRAVSTHLITLLSAKDETIAKRTAVELVGRGFR